MGSMSLHRGKDVNALELYLYNGFWHNKSVENRLTGIYIQTIKNELK